MVRREEVLEKDMWYYIEGTWDKSSNKIFINHKEGDVKENIQLIPAEKTSAHLILVGKEHSSQIPSSIFLDDLEMFYGDRPRLNRLNLRLTGSLIYLIMTMVMMMMMRVIIMRRIRMMMVLILMSVYIGQKNRLR